MSISGSKIFVFGLFIVLSQFVFGSDEGVAKAIILRGEIQEVPVKGKPKMIKRGDWIKEGSVLKSSSRSFVKLLFIDKSQMNLGPNSEMKIKEFPRDKAGIIDLIKGKVRSKVTKNYMDMDKKKSKLFIKTKTAAMGVRGTDFQVIFNPRNAVTSLVTFEGAVAMAKIDSTLRDNQVNQNALENSLNRRDSVVVRQGQYSGSLPNQKRVSIPVKISPTQLESMKTSDGDVSQSDRKPASASPSENKQKVVRSVVPAGLDPKKFAESNQGTVEKAMEGGLGSDSVKRVVEKTQASIDQERSSGPPPEGFVDKATGAFAPPAGGFVDEKTGLYVPPSEGSSFDPNAGVYIPAPDVGSVDPETGAYVPPEGYKLVDSGELVPLEGRDIASVEGGEAPTSDGGSNVNVMDATTLDGESLDDSDSLDTTSESDELAQDFQLESTQDFNNPDLNTSTSGRSKVQFRISR